MWKTGGGGINESDAFSARGGSTLTAELRWLPAGEAPQYCLSGTQRWPMEGCKQVTTSQTSPGPAFIH